MPIYRAFLIDDQNRIVSFRVVDAETDEEALRAAQRLVDGCDVEVWYLDRKVGWLSRQRL